MSHHDLPRLPGPRRADGGFSMVEIIIAATVLVIAIMASFSAMGTSHEVSKTATSRSRVLERVQKTVEDIQGTAFGSYALTSFTVDTVEPPEGRATVGTINVLSQVPGRKIKYQIEARWRDQYGEMQMSTVYTHVNRGY